MNFIEEVVINTIRKYTVIDKEAAVERSHNLRDDLGSLTIPSFVPSPVA